MYVFPKELFMEDLNSIIDLGKIPDLFENEELDAIALRLRSLAEESGYVDNRQILLSFFQKVHFCGLPLSNCHIKLKIDYIQISQKFMPLFVEINPAMNIKVCIKKQTMFIILYMNFKLDNFFGFLHEFLKL